MKIIPAIDIIEGKCVRLSQGDYASKTVYNENPLDVALSFQDHGIEQLHLVDLDGAKSSRVINWKVLEEIASKTHMKIDFGGGVKSDEDIKKVFESGATQITAGSIAVKSPETVIKWMEEYGPERIILGADVKGNRVAVNGWLEESKIELFPFLEEYFSKGIQYVICTDISKDGMLAGSSTELYSKITSSFPDLKLIASGGVSSLKELDKLATIGVYGAIIGKAIYEGKITLKELEKFILKTLKNAE
ncbi:MAG: 1-(5-phosphoribosyl)-5-[(5-phosphoribosylamino)methylideneamino]imidazole-4-carboxamide isomerase [Brumimicrobium sp.]|nr:1-(5-phosphoribosyl)-5-[(5-phosphoribosylamino)methylideneamino]imidazole-4-carboxamide isomerase [Brumimicrobium sp.]